MVYEVLEDCGPEEKVTVTVSQHLEAELLEQL